MKLTAILVAATALASGGFALFHTTDGQKKALTEEHKRAQMGLKAQKKQMTEEQRRAWEEKMADKRAQKGQTFDKKTAKGQQKQMSEEQKRAWEEKMAAKRAHKSQDKKTFTDQEKKAWMDLQDKKSFGQPLKQGKPYVLTTQADVAKALGAGSPVLAEFTISYHEIVGLKGQHQWHIGDSSWWVRLHMPTTTVELDKSKRYRVVGHVMEQNYGVVEVWLKKLSSLD
jgi:hypothetical protein